MTKQSSSVLLSIREQHVKKIIAGEKKAEIRKVFSSKNISRVYVYVPSTRKEIIGYFDIKKIYNKKVNELWDISGKSSALSRDFFFTYLEGKDTGISIHFDGFIHLPESKSLRQIKKIYPKFHPPQSFIYVTPEMERFLFSKI